VTGTLTVIDEEIPPESDSGAMALLGYDPLVRYPGRGPLEGLGTGFLGIESDASTVCSRINVASLSTEQGALDRRTARDLTDAHLQALLTEIRRGGGRVRPDDCHVFSERATAAGALGRLRACELMPALTGLTTAPVIPWSANQEPTHDTEEPS
jgi:2,3-bisphosphoglycerate-independent phosphoglycerate mutase